MTRRRACGCVLGGLALWLCVLSAQAAGQGAAGQGAAGRGGGAPADGQGGQGEDRVGSLPTRNVR